MFGQRGAPHACVKKHVGAATPTDFVRASPRKYRGLKPPEPPLFLRHWCCELHVLFFIPSSHTSSFFHVLLIVTYLVRFHFFSLPFPSLPLSYLHAEGTGNPLPAQFANLQQLQESFGHILILKLISDRNYLLSPTVTLSLEPFRAVHSLIVRPHYD